MIEIKTRLKGLLQSILTNKVFIFLFIKFNIKENYIEQKDGFVSVINQSDFLKALIYTGFYERKEREIINKFIRKDLDVIELGSSLGIITLTICKNCEKRVFSVEANSKLIENLNRTKAKNELNQLTIYSRAISYGSEYVKFDIDNNNLGSKISDTKGILVKAITLEEIYYSNKINKFILVSDIEGSEIDFILNLCDNVIIENCMQIIIELHEIVHEGQLFTKEKMADLIALKFKMSTIYNAGDIWVFEKITI